MRIRLLNWPWNRSRRSGCWLRYRGKAGIRWCSSGMPVFVLGIWRLPRCPRRCLQLGGTTPTIPCTINMDVGVRVRVVVIFWQVRGWSWWAGARWTEWVARWSCVGRFDYNLWIYIISDPSKSIAYTSPSSTSIPELLICMNMGTKINKDRNNKLVYIIELDKTYITSQYPITTNPTCNTASSTPPLLLAPTKNDT